MKIDLGANLIVTIDGVDAYWIEHHGVMRCYWTSELTVCCDGSGGNPDDDPCFQPQTAYYNGGDYLNPYQVPYIVVPPQVRSGVAPVVMGCQGLCLNLTTGQAVGCIVGDIGPTDHIGEASVDAAERVGLDGSPNHGGTNERIILYVIWPGIPAEVDGVEYKLQPA